MGVGTDVRHAARALAGRPGFTVVAALTLALGVGATTAVFSAVYSVLLRPLPYGAAEQIVVLRQTDRRAGTERQGVSAANVRDLAASASTLAHVAGAAAYGFTLLDDGRAQSLRGWQVSEGFFEAMGASLALGRAFLPEEYLAGGERVVVLGHHTWTTRFARDPGILGSELVVDGVAHRVVGILDPDFKYPSAGELWAPRPPQPWDEEVRAGAQMDAVARLAPGASPVDAQSELDGLAGELATRYPTSNANTGFRVVPLRTHLFGDVSSPLLLLLGAVVLLLLITSANVAGLQLARGSARAHEYALRRALGAGYARILRLVAAESLLLAIGGAVVGIGLAALGVEGIRLLGPDHLPRIDEVRLDGLVLSFAIAASAGTALLSGVVPALRGSRVAPGGALAESGRGASAGGGTGAFRDRIVMVQIALALVLTSGAGLLVRSFDRLLDNELGFDPRNRLAMQVFAYDDQDQPHVSFVRSALEAIANVPGVEAVGLTTSLPLADNVSVWAMAGTARFSVEGEGAPGEGGEPQARISGIDGGYPRALGIAVVAGRGFDDRDDRNAPRVAVVNEAFVRRYVQSGSAVGKRLVLSGSPDAPFEIIGVLEDVRPRGLESEPAPEIHIPWFQSPGTGGVTFVVRTRTRPAGLAGAVREAIWRTDPGQAIWASHTMEGLLGDWTRERRFNTALFTAFAALALALAAIGVYGLVSFSITQRVRELGIRRALGADGRSILRIVLRRALALAAVGVAAGLLGALVLSRLMEGMLFGVEPFDPVTFAAVSGIVIGIAVLAAIVPARRATRVDPVTALRADA